MTKITLNNVASLQNTTTAQTTINNNSAVVQAAMENTLSRDGTSPNTMLANLDMNANRVLNLPAPGSSTEPLRVIDAANLVGGGSITVTGLPGGGTTGQVLTKNTNTTGDVGWQTKGRTKLIADTTFYVSTTGSDITGDGSIGNPWLTGQNAFLQIISTYDGGGHNVTLQLVGSPFNVPANQSFIFSNQEMVGIQQFSIVGNPASPSSFVVDGSLTTVSAVNLSPAAIGNRIVIDGIKFQNWSTNVISLQSACFVDVNNAVFQSNGTVFDVESQGTLSGRNGTWTFTGTNVQMCYVGSGGILDTNKAPIVFSGGAAFTFAVLNVDQNSFIHFYKNVTGTCTGPRVFINHGGSIVGEVAGGGSSIALSALPGSTNGTNNGGWYNNELGGNTATFASTLAAPTATITGAVTAASLAVSSQNGVGYGPGGAGTGGTVTQITSKSTGVTINKVSGLITMANSSLAAGAAVAFLVSNSSVATTDVVVLNIDSGSASPGTYNYGVNGVFPGAFNIYLQNISAGPLSEAVAFNFAVIKGVIT
jgi:hypothetical protein